MKTIILRYNVEAGIRNLGSVDTLKDWLLSQSDWASGAEVSLTIVDDLPDNGGVEWCMWCY